MTLESKLEKIPLKERLPLISEIAYLYYDLEEFEIVDSLVQVGEAFLNRGNISKEDKVYFLLDKGFLLDYPLHRDSLRRWFGDIWKEPGPWQDILYIHQAYDQIINKDPDFTPKRLIEVIDRFKGSSKRYFRHFAVLGTDYLSTYWTQSNQKDSAISV